MTEKELFDFIEKSNCTYDEAGKWLKQEIIKELVAAFDKVMDGITEDLSNSTLLVDTRKELFYTYIENLQKRLLKMEVLK